MNRDFLPRLAHGFFDWLFDVTCTEAEEISPPFDIHKKSKAYPGYQRDFSPEYDFAKARNGDFWVAKLRLEGAIRQRLLIILLVFSRVLLSRTRD